MKILESYSAIAKSLLLEDDDDRYVHIGYGKYKEKDSRTGEPLPNSPVYIKTDAGKYIMPDDDEKGGEEEPKGGGMGSGDFERDFDDSEPEDKPFGGDTGRDADYGDEKSSYFDDPADLSPSQKAHTAAADAELDRIDKDDEPKVPAPDSKSDTGKPRVSANPYDDNYGQEVDGPSPEDSDWNSETVMTAKLDGEEVGDIIGDEGHPKYKEALKYIMSFDPDDEKLYTGTGWKGHSGAKEETVTINGKKYRPIKESKQHILKENYERFFGDKK